VATKSPVPDRDPNEGNQCELTSQLLCTCWLSACSVFLCLDSRNHPQATMLFRTFGHAVRCTTENLQGVKSAHAVMCKKLISSRGAQWHMLWAV